MLKEVEQNYFDMYNYSVLYVAFKMRFKRPKLFGKI